MSLMGKMLKRAVKKIWTRTMDKFGSRIVSRMADTSSDAPNAFHEPKRNVYAQMQNPKQPASKKEQPSSD